MLFEKMNNLRSLILAHLLKFCCTWKKSNRLSVMYIKTKVNAGIRGSVEQYEDVHELLKAIDEQFITLDKALAP